MTYAGFPEEVHHRCFRFIAEAGHAPSVEELASESGRSVEEVKQGLNQLRDMHGVVLVPGSYEFWSLHPFSLLPTAHWVTAGRRGWWANCAWCSLAIGSSLKSDITVSTFDGGEGEPLRFEVRNGVASQKDVLAHFPTPPARWWDNPFCPCVNILFFTSEAKIGDWCVRHGSPKGSILDMGKMIRLADLWFGDYGSPDWKRKTPDGAARIFQELDLDRSFWNIPRSFR